MKDTSSRKETALLMGLWYCDRICGDKGRKVTGRVHEALNRKKESSGGNMMKSNSKEKEEWDSVTGRAEVTEVRGKVKHLQQSFKDAIIYFQLKWSSWDIKTKLDKVCQNRDFFKYIYY